MSTAPSYFKDFLSNIRLSDNQVKDLKTGHTTLRRRLEEDETLSKIIISTFLQGSYRRSTAVKPKNGNKSDVDVIVVTKLDSNPYYSFSLCWIGCKAIICYTDEWQHF